MRKERCLVSVRRRHGHVDGDQFWRGAQTAHDGGHAILAERSDRSADVHNFRRFQIGAERGQHARPGHGHLNGAESEQRMPAYIHAPIHDRRDRARRIQRHIAFEKYGADHVSGTNVSIVGPRVDAAALCRRHAIRGKFVLELPDGHGAEARKDERGINRRQKTSAGNAGPRRPIRGNLEARFHLLRRRRRVRRVSRRESRRAGPSAGSKYFQSA